MHIDYDLAEILTEQFNSYAMFMEGIGELEVEFVLSRLQATFDPEDLKFLIEDDFGRGVVMGQLHTLFALEVLDGPTEED